MLECKILTSESEVESIADEWRQLQVKSGRSPFTDYDWFMTWWRTLGKSHGARTLHVITGRRAEQLVGVLPLTVVRTKGLRIMHAGGHKAFYYCDMICENAPEAAELWSTACHSRLYDFADIRDVHTESLCYDALCSFARQRDVTGAYSVRINWPASEGWLESLSKGARRNIARYTRHLEEKAPVRYEMCRASPLPADVIDGMIKNKITWSMRKEKRGLFDHPGIFEFFHQLLDLAARQDRLFFIWLKCGEDTIAYFLWFIYRQTLRGYVVTYDPAWAHYSPGNLILANSIEWAVDNGLTGVDIGQGGGSYKAKFCNETRACVEFTFSGSRMGRLIEAAFTGTRQVWRVLMRKKLERY